MAIEIAGKDTLLAVNATQITAEFPAGVVSSDLLLACVTHMWGGGSHISTPTNWTLIGNQAFTAFGTQSWFWRIAGTSEPEPTFTNTSPGAREWHVSIRQIRGHHATTPIVGYNTSGGATPAQVTPSAGAFAAPVVNSGYTNNLVYYSCYQYQAAPPSAPGSIRYAFGVAPGQVETGVSGLTGAESTQLMALPSSTAIASAVWAYVVTGTTTAVKIMRAAAAVLGGKMSGAGTGTETFRDIDDTKDVIVATVDSSGNRTALTRDLT